MGMALSLARSSRGKKIVTLILSLVVVFSLAAVSFAEGVGDVSDGIGDALETVQGDVLNVIKTVAPYGIAIMGAFLVWRYGLKFFNSISKGK